MAKTVDKVLNLKKTQENFFFSFLSLKVLKYFLHKKQMLRIGNR